jgi:hypothetical protein
MCIITWLKRWPNILVWLILHGLGHCDDHWDHRHNHTCKTFLWSGPYVFVKDIWKAKENALDITLYQVWPRWFFIDGVFISFYGGKFLCMFHSIGVSTSSHLPSKNSHTYACVMYVISIDTCLCSRPSPWESTPNPHLKKRILFNFGLELTVIWDFNPCL